MMKSNNAFSVKVLTLVVAAVVAVAMLGAFTGGVVLMSLVSGNAQAAPVLPATNVLQAASQAAPGDAEMVAAYERVLSDLYAAALPSVVSIQVTERLDRSTGLPFGHPDVPAPDNQDRPGGDFFFQGQGSGFVWDTAGHILTNNHVVDGATDVEVTFADGKVAKAEILGGDPDSDLAVIKVDLPAAELQPAVLGDSNNLRVGQLAIAIGNPFGQEFTMTSGIISAVGRTIRSGNTAFSIPKAIQTDASINPGNSGGPLLDRTGAVIGINAQILSRSGVNDGVGFALPINLARQIVPSLIKGETYQHAWLGISGTDVTLDLVQAMHLPANSRGVVIIEAIKDGPAAKAGLVASTGIQTVNGQRLPVGGDIITAINGQPIQTMDDLIGYLAENLHPGDMAQLELLKADGSQKSVDVTLEARPNAEALRQ